MPTVYQSSHTGSNIDIAITKTLGCQGLPSVSNSDSGKMLQVVNGLWSAVAPESNLTMSSVLNAVYPVGAIYLSVNSTSPATLFGGTWEQIKDKFLLGVGDTYTTVGNTGGAASQSYTPEGTVDNHTLTTAELPSHTHGLNGHVHSIPAHNHSLNSHKHSYSKSNTPTNGPSTTNTGSETINFSNGVALAYVNTANGKGYIDVSRSGTKFTPNYGFTNSTAGYSTTTQTGGSTALSGSQSHSHTLNSHTHAITFTSTQSDGPSTTNTGDKAAFNTNGPSPTDTTATGSGTAHNHGFTGTAATITTMPPYLTVYIWKRTA